MKKIVDKLKYGTGMMALALSLLLSACGGQESSVDNTSDVTNGSDMDNAGDDPADTLSIGGSSNGRPSGAGVITDSVATPGVRLDSIQQSQTGTNTSSYGDNSNNEESNGLDANKPSGQNKGNGTGIGTDKKGNKQ
jgi:hypothetical protein